MSKLDERISAGGAVDETNSCIGLALAACHDAEITQPLRQVQQWLFDLGADLSVPWSTTSSDRKALRIKSSHVAWLEQQIDDITARLQPLESFVLPGGSETAARLHFARCVCRRAELLLIQVGQKTEINPQVLLFMNRLSDLLFVLARQANNGGKDDILWQPAT